MQKICKVCGKENEAFKKYCVGCDASLSVTSSFNIPLSYDGDHYDGSKSDTLEEKVDSESVKPEISDADTDTDTDTDSDSDSDSDEVNISRYHKPDPALKDLKSDSNELYQVHKQVLDSNDHGGTLLKLNYLLCPYCGELNKQSEFFCQRCSCDLKVVKTIKVPSGKMETYQRKYKTRAMDYLVGEDHHNVEGQFKQFLSLAHNKSLDSSNWVQARDMRLEASGMVIPKGINVIVGIACSVIARRLDLPFASMMIILVPLILNFVQKKVFLYGEDEVVLLTEEGIDIIREVGNSTEKARDIKWPHIQEIVVVGSGNEQRLKLQSTDKEYTCMLPRFGPKKRTMMLNIFGIIANRNQYKVYYES